MGDMVPFLLYTVMGCLGVSDWQARKEVPIQINDRWEPEEFPFSRHDMPNTLSLTVLLCIL